MEELSCTVELLCPLCGNKQFALLDKKIGDRLHASDDVQVRCSDCGYVCTKCDLLDENAEIINNAMIELAQRVESELEEVLKKWRI
jgi:uncharacterized Zn finger protein